MKLPVISAGETIGLVAPAGNVTLPAIEPGIELLKKAGYKVVQGRHLLGKYRHYSGTKAERSHDIQEFLEDPQIKVIYAVRGGAGSALLLDQFDFSNWQKAGKLLVGFSDITALQWGVWGQTGLPSLSGMTMSLQLRPENRFLNRFFQILDGQKRELAAADFPQDSLKFPVQGKAEGLLMGGTLSVITTLLGTRFFPELPEIILYLEEVNEPLFRVERSLVQLQQAGVTAKVKALILGQFTLKDKPLAIWPMAADYFPKNIPVINAFPYGHQINCCPLPLGVAAQLSTFPFSLKWD